MTVTGKDALVFDALMNRVETLPTDLPVALPDIDFKPATEAPDGRYLVVSYFPNRPAWEGLSEGVLDQGLLQIDVVWPRTGNGLVEPLQVATGIKAHFAKSTVMVAGSARVKVAREPTISPPLIEDDKTSIPVTISWVA